MTHLRAIAVLSGIILLQSCVPPKSIDASGLADEGRTGIAGRTPDDIVAEIQKRFDVGELSPEVIKASLISAALGTIQIKCTKSLQFADKSIAMATSSATGFFVEPSPGQQNRFMTAGHVAQTDLRNCKVLYHTLEDGKFVLEEKSTSLLIDHVKQDMLAPGFRDLAEGRLYQFPTPQKLSLAAGGVPLKGRLVMSIGFPGSTRRAKDERPVEEKRMDVLVTAGVLRGEAQYERAGTQLLRESYRLLNGDDAETRKITEQVLERADKEAAFREQLADAANKYFSDVKNLKTNGDQLLSISGESFLSIGRVYHDEGGFIATDSDIAQGMSGGPAIDLATGRVVGVASAIIPVSDEGKISKTGTLRGLYTPINVYSRLDESIFKGFVDAPAPTVPACRCQWSFVEDGALYNSTVLKSPFYLFLQAAQKGLIVTQHQSCSLLSNKSSKWYVAENGNSYYNQLTDCQDVAVAMAPGLTFFGMPGEAYREVDPQRPTITLRRNLVDPDVASYFPSSPDEWKKFWPFFPNIEPKIGGR